MNKVNVAVALAFGLLLAPGLASASRWSAEGFPTEVNLNGIVAVTSDQAWVVGDAGLILKRDGSGWHEAEDLPQGLDQWNLRAVDVAGNDIWIVGEKREEPSKHIGIILKGTNGGEAWKTIYPDLPLETPPTPFYDIHVPGDGSGWIAAGHGLVLQTTDGGGSWRAYDVSSFSDHFQSVWAQDVDNAWTCSDNSGGVVHTTDGGASWHPNQPFPVPEGEYRLPDLMSTPQFSRAIAALWASGFDNAYVALSEGRVGETTDRGENWSVYTIAPRGVWFRDVWSKGEHAWAVGTSGEIRYFRSGGQFWGKEGGDADYHLNDVEMLDDLSGYGWAVGTNGTILRRLPMSSPRIDCVENFSPPFAEIVWDINPESPVDSFQLLKSFENEHGEPFDYVAAFDFIDGLGRYAYTDFHEYGGPNSYYYWVRTFYSDGDSELAGPLAVPARGFVVPEFPPSPADLSAVRTPHGVLLTWGPIGPYAYRVYRSEIASGPYAYIGETRQSYYVDEEVDEKATYFYLLRSAGAELTSPDSPLASIGPQSDGYDVLTGIDPSGTYYDVKRNIAYFSWIPVEDSLLGGYWVSLNDFGAGRELRNVSALSRDWYSVRYPFPLPADKRFKYGVLPMDRVGRVGRTWWDYKLPVGACNTVRDDATVGNNAVRFVEREEDGSLHLVYTDDVKGRSKIFYVTSGDSGLFWSEPAWLGDGVSPALASNNKGLYAVWLEKDEKKLFLAWNVGMGWQTPYLLFESDQDITPPSFVVNEKIGFLATVMKDAVHWGWFLLDEAYSASVLWQSISDVEGSGLRASIDLDGSNSVHVCYSSGLVGEIYYWNQYMGTGAHPVNVSESPKKWSRFPSLNIDREIPRVVWEEQDTLAGVDAVVKCWQLFAVPDTSLGDLTTVGGDDPGNSSLEPGVHGGTVLWMREHDEPGGWVSFEIYGSRFVYDTSFTWEDGENYSEILWAPSKHPQLLISGDKFFGVWTEGVPPHNWIRVEERNIDDRVIAFYKLGGLLKNQITWSRDGYLWYGDRVYKKVDYSDSALVYRIEGLSLDSSYAIGIGFYQETGDTLRQYVYVNDELFDVVDVPKATLTYTGGSSPVSVTDDRSITIKIQHPDSGIAVCSYISLSYAPTGGSGPQNMAAMHRAAGKRPSIRVFPSPFRHSTTIELLNIDPLTDHAVSIYDVAGRLVDKLPLSNGAATWTPNNRPTGIYFLKLNTHPDIRTTKLLKLE